MTITKDQIKALQDALSKLPTHPAGADLDDIHFGAGAGILTNEEYFAAKMNENDGMTADRKHILFTSVLRAWRERIEEALKSGAE